MKGFFSFKDSQIISTLSPRKTFFSSFLPCNMWRFNCWPTKNKFFFPQQEMFDQLRWGSFITAEWKPITIYGNTKAFLSNHIKENFHSKKWGRLTCHYRSGTKRSGVYVMSIFISWQWPLFTAKAHLIYLVSYIENIPILIYGSLTSISWWLI